MTSLTATPLTPAVGARIEGIELHRPLDQATVDALQAALYRYGMLLFKNVSIGEAEQIRLARYFGRISKVGASASQPDAVYVSNAKEDGVLGNDELSLHADKFYLPTPPKAAMLFAIEVTAEGGETRFVKTDPIIQSMDSALRERLLNLKVRHEYDYRLRYGSPGAAVSSKPFKQTIEGKIEVTEHPVISKHPWSDAYFFAVNTTTAKRIVGVSDEESRALLDSINEMIETAPDSYRHRWQVGDLIFWDNYLLQHARTPFAKGEQRTLRRCQIASEFEPVAAAA